MLYSSTQYLWHTTSQQQSDNNNKNNNDGDDNIYVSHYNKRTTAAVRRHNNTARIAHTVQHNNIVAAQSCAYLYVAFSSQHRCLYESDDDDDVTPREFCDTAAADWTTGRTDGRRAGGTSEPREKVWPRRAPCRERERESGCGKIRRRRREGRWVKKHLSAHSYNNNNSSNIIM